MFYDFICSDSDPAKRFRSELIQIRNTAWYIHYQRFIVTKPNCHFVFEGKRLTCKKGMSTDFEEKVKEYIGFSFNQPNHLQTSRCFFPTLEKTLEHSTFSVFDSKFYSDLKN